MVEIEHASFSYDKKDKILNNINLSVSPGECILLCGESGCGKTTITKLINGLIPNFQENGVLSGCIKVNKMLVGKMEMYEICKYAGSVFQNPKSQFFHLDSDSEIVFGLENSGIAKSEMIKRYEKTIENLSIQSLVHKNVFSMSGGEKQILAFASVYAMNPKIYVLDEPTANLDARSIQILHDRIESLKREGRTVIIAEHRLYFLMDLVDRVMFIKKGKIHRIFLRNEFLQIGEEERIAMGLRTLKAQNIKIPNSKIYQSMKGLVIENLRCDIKKKLIFESCTLHAKYGEIIGIIGNNGAGKTTLTRCICGLVPESYGIVKLDGKILNRKQRNKFSYLVMQDVNHQLFSDSVWNECQLANFNCSKKDIENVLNLLQLLQFKDSHPMALSGGQKQRLAIATALLSDKKILVFDEPTSGLDYSNMIAVSKVIKKVAALGKVILVVSHDIEFLNIICDGVYRMNGSEGE